MPLTYTIGTLPDDFQWVHDLVLPHVDGLHASPLLVDAVDFVTSTRKGAVATGPKGAGKSYGRREAVGTYEAREALLHAKDAAYEPQRIIVLTLVRASRPEDVYVGLWKALVDEEPELRVRGRRKREDEIRIEFLHLAHAQRLAAIVFDEGEYVRGALLHVARDIVSHAEEIYKLRAPRPDVAPARDFSDGCTDDGDGAPRAAGTTSHVSGTGSAAHGIGVLIVGTPPLLVGIERSAEGGQRWAKPVAVPPPPPDMAPVVYTTWFAGFAPSIRAMGTRAWEDFIAKTIVRGRPLSMRLLDSHAREYVRHIAGRLPAVRRLADVPFERELFETVFAQVDTLNSRGERG